MDKEVILVQPEISEGKEFYLTDKGLAISLVKRPPVEEINPCYQSSDDEHFHFMSM